jgi:hypothetical protein
MRSYHDRFLSAYIECALWSSTDNADDTGGEPLDANYSVDDLSPECLEAMRKDCASFIAASGVDASDNWTADQAGHDFWLTRNAHGAGFWDRGHGAEGADLTQHAKSFGSCDLYVGDDESIHAA